MENPSLVLFAGGLGGVSAGRVCQCGSSSLTRCWCAWWSMGAGVTLELQDSGDLFSEVANAN